jgi:hypothetical protein
MARRPKTHNVKIAPGKRQILGVLLVVAVVAWLLSVPLIGGKVAGALGIPEAQFTHVADTIFTFTVAVLFFILAFVMGGIPIFGFLLVMVGVAVLYHGIRKIF